MDRNGVEMKHRTMPPGVAMVAIFCSVGNAQKIDGTIFPSLESEH